MGTLKDKKREQCNMVPPNHKWYVRSLNDGIWLRKPAEQTILFRCFFGIEKNFHFLYDNICVDARIKSYNSLKLQS